LADAAAREVKRSPAARPLHQGSDMSPGQAEYEQVECLRDAVKRLADAADFAEHYEPKKGEGLQDLTQERHAVERLATPEMPLPVANPENWTARLHEAAREVNEYMVARRQGRRPPKPSAAVRHLRACHETLCKIPFEFYGNPKLVKRFRDALTPATPPATPTLYHHSDRSYSLAGGTPTVVSPEEHNILCAFLKAGGALDTRALEKHASNAARIIRQLDKKFPGAVRRPQKKGEGYYIRVESAPKA
jgi:hypothetical protein